MSFWGFTTVLISCHLILNNNIIGSSRYGERCLSKSSKSINRNYIKFLQILLFVLNINSKLFQECKQAASMQCPKCLELKLAPSYFCSQKCFKDCWGWHKLVHTGTVSFFFLDDFEAISNEYLLFTCQFLLTSLTSYLVIPTTSSSLPRHFEGYRFTGIKYSTYLLNS